MIMARTFRHEMAQVMLLSMLFSLTMAVMPTKAEAGLLGSVFSGLKTASRFLVVNGGALVAGYFGGVLGAALGGGPIGMVAGGVGGFLAAKKALTWATESSTRVATIVGAAAGGLLVAGMGMPLLAIGVIGGGLLGWSISKLIGKLTGRAVQKAEMKAQDDKFNQYLNTVPAVPAVAPAPEVKTATAQPTAAAVEKVDSVSQAYDKYLAAYKSYMAASEKGDTAAAQSSYAEYKKYLTLYNSLMKN